MSQKDEMVTIDGVQKRAEDWAKDLKIKWDTVKQRRARGCNWREALSTQDKRRALTIKDKGDGSSFKGGRLTEARRPYA